MNPAQLNQLFCIHTDLRKQLMLIEQHFDATKRLIMELAILEATMWAKKVEEEEASDDNL